jgi:pimeloyl-ACP methyl ester carboxylesterase
MGLLSTPFLLTSVGRALVAAVAFVTCLAGVLYWRPLWATDEFTRAWFRIVGARSEYVQLGSFRIHFFCGGRGRPLVLVHGLGGKAENWVKLMPPLMRRGYRVYAIDLLGFGRSDRPDVDYSIGLQASVLDKFLGSQKLDYADLGGWSMGGWVALKYALDYPQRVRRIFVADSLGIKFDLNFDPTLFEAASVDRAQQLLTLLTSKRLWIRRFVARDFARRMRPRRWVVRRATQSMMAQEDLLDGKLCAIRAPVLIVWGTQDALIPLKCGEEMHRQIPHSCLAICEGGGHLSLAECSRRILPEILRFLEAEPPLPASVQEFPE